MDAFWIIPLGIVGMAFLWGFYAYLKKQPSAASAPHVIVDRPATEPTVDEDTQSRDWEGRPCGSYLDWRHGGGK